MVVAPICVVASGGFAFLSFIFFDRNDEMNI